MDVDRARQPSVREWLEPMLKAWRDQTFGLWSGEDGWPPRSVLGRIKDDGPGAGRSGVKQRVFETYAGEGLLIRRAIEGMPILQRQVLAVHYLARGSATEKAEALGISKSKYWAILDTAYFYLAGRIGSGT